MAKIHKSRLDWVKSISKEELEKRFKDAKTLAETAKKKISFYEEELERRKQEIPLVLGVPFVPKTGEEYWWVDIGGNPIHSFFEGGHVDFQVLSECGCFKSYASAVKHAKMLKDWRKDGLVANAKGEPIDIKVLCPLFRKGYVFYDNIFGWRWSKEKPEIFKNRWTIRNDATYTYLDAFNIKPADNWEYSLMECGL